jgi:phospholipase C
MAKDGSRRPLPPLPRIGRRAVLKGLGAAGLSPLVGCEPTPGGEDPTPDPGPGLQSRDPADVIDTVVILMMENRSFDHYFGALTLEEGRTDIDGLTADMSNPHPDGGSVAPFVAETNCLTEDPPHSWGSSRSQLADGACSGFVQAQADRHGPENAHEVMGYFNREKLGPLYAIAEKHVLCERWFCSVLGSTWPNRFYSHAAQNGGERGNDFSEEPFPSIYPRLEQAGVSWGDYYGNVPFTYLLRDVLPGENIKPFEDFYIDAQIGILPNVTILEPMYGRADDHPPTHPVAGQILISSVYQALANSPHWERCLFIVTYDEHGGFFDHVPPPLAADERAAEGFDQLGFRVPAVVAGPWTKEGDVNSVVYDHASILAFLERRFGIEPLTERDAAANDLWDVFDLDRIARREPMAPASLPVIEADEEELYAPECGYGSLFRGPSDSITGQPELEAFADEVLVGTRFDRREQTDELHAAWLEAMKAKGIWRMA